MSIIDQSAINVLAENIMKNINRAVYAEINALTPSFQTWVDCQATIACDETVYDGFKVVDEYRLCLSDYVNCKFDYWHSCYEEHNYDKDCSKYDESGHFYDCYWDNINCEDKSWHNCKWFNKDCHLCESC